MHVLVTGAGGMLGRKLVDALAQEGRIGGSDIRRATLMDRTAPTAPDFTPFEVAAIAGDISRRQKLHVALARRPDVIFHLAAIVSAEAERDHAAGYRTNLDGLRALLHAIRAVGDGYTPRLIFASSIAVFGAPLPDLVPEDHVTAPLTSYGTQKAIGELLVADESRRGFIDGISLRLPTIVVRPGQPNAAASGFFSSIIRDPLAGMEAVLPVPETVTGFFASPRAAIAQFLHAAALDTQMLGARRSLNMPGVSTNVAGMIAALSAIAGERVAARIRQERDPDITDIVSQWPKAFDASRALALGFAGDESFEAIVRSHIEDELHGRFVA